MIDSKPKIKEFVWHERFMAIHWDDMPYAFEISVQWGDAKIFHPPPPDSQYGGIHGGVDLSQMGQFVLRPTQEIEQVEVVLEVTYGPREKSLGVTNQISTAERWVIAVNSLLQKLKAYKDI